jgi:uncharacterized membrane protein
MGRAAARTVKQSKGESMSQEVAVNPKAQDAINAARILYFMHGVCFFFSFGVFNLVPLVINYSKRPDAEGTIAFSHHTWMIRSFWFYVLWVAVGWVCAATLIGIPVALCIWGVTWLWEAYRIVRGFVDLNNGRPAAL